MAALRAAAQPPAALFGAQQTPAPAAEPSDEIAPLASVPVEEVAAPGRLQFFTADEMTAFRRLADLLLPRTVTPGALDAQAPEFLDLLLSQSGAARQALYRDGVRRWMTGGGGEALLEPLRRPWTPEVPADRWAAFLRAAKEDLWRATVSSRAWAVGTEGRGRRRGMPAPSGATYWHVVD